MLQILNAIRNKVYPEGQEEEKGIINNFKYLKSLDSL